MNPQEHNTTSINIHTAHRYLKRCDRHTIARPPGRRMWIGCLAAALLTPGLEAALPSSDITLQPVVTDNLPIITSLTGYSVGESTAAGANAQHPLYYPYDSSAAPWWDNLLAEELQARLPVLMFASRGAYTLTPTDLTGPGNMNPRRLKSLADAITRANAGSLVKVACFIDTPALEVVYTNFHGLPGGTVMSLATASDWNDIFWLRGVKPWFDTVPSQYWYKINNRPVIQWWSIAAKWFSNQNGNASQMLQFISNSFNAAYGVRPVFIIDGPWATSLDPSSTSQPDVIGVNSWFGPPSTPNKFTTFNGFVSGTSVAGFIDPGYYDPASSNYHNLNRVIFRDNVNGTGVNGDTERAGLDAAVAANADLTVLEGWTDVEESAGLYRCLGAAEWDRPNQYINLVREYTDLRTVTLRLEAEGCDEYFDTTTGNSGGAFRRSGDLDVRALSSSGWAVTNTAANEWIQFDRVYCSSGNYKFPIRYSAVAAGKRVRFSVDGVAVPDVTLPPTGGADTFDTISLGQKTLGFGTHTFRILFLDGGVDLDWLFVKKYDPMITFRASNGFYASAELGGDNVVIANRTAIGNWEKFSADDTNGGTLTANDVINLQAHDGLYLSASGGGGGSLTVDRRHAQSWEQFTIVKLNGSGAIVNGDSVAIRSLNGKYLTVGSGNIVDVTGASAGAAQTFTVTLGTQ